MRRLSAFAALAVGVLLVAYSLFSSPSDEEQILAVLDELSSAVSYEEPQNPLQRTAQLNGAFKEIFGKEVVVKVPEVGADTQGRGSLGQLGARASMPYQSLDLGFADVSIEAGETAANVTATAALSGTQGGEMRADERAVDLRFEKIDGDWRVVRVRVSPPADSVD